MLHECCLWSPKEYYSYINDSYSSGKNHHYFPSIFLIAGESDCVNPEELMFSGPLKAFCPLLRSSAGA